MGRHRGQVAATPGRRGRLGHRDGRLVLGRGGVVAHRHPFGQGADHGLVGLFIGTPGRPGLEGLQQGSGEAGHDADLPGVQARQRVGHDLDMRRGAVRPQRGGVEIRQQHRLGIRRCADRERAGCRRTALTPAGREQHNQQTPHQRGAEPAVAGQG